MTSVTTDRVDDRVECREVLGPHLDVHALAARGHAAGRGLDVVGEHRRGVERLAIRLDRAQDRARGVVAADAVEAVGDLAAPFAIDDGHEVEHPRRDVALVLGGALQRTARAVRPRSPPASCPARSRRSSAAALTERPPRVARRARCSSSASSGPCRARRVLGRLARCPAPRPGGSDRRSRQSASTSSLRVNSVASPRIASMIRRS